MHDSLLLVGKFLEFMKGFVEEWIQFLNVGNSLTMLSINIDDLPLRALASKIQARRATQ